MMSEYKTEAGMSAEKEQKEYLRSLRWKER